MKSSIIDKLMDKVSPLYSFRCGHKIRRVKGCYSGLYCDKCELVVPEVNAITK
jgi:hypothetical protein